MNGQINVSPFATNVLDLVGKDLMTMDGYPVTVSRDGMDFVVKINGSKHYQAADNLNVSYCLNTLGIKYTAN